jgi:hypothetical protein
MPKLIDYPKASLRRSFVMADAVEKLGGEASMHSVAEVLGNKVSGSFKTWVGGAVKYGLIDNARGRLSTQPLYKDYKHAYTKLQQQETVRKAFMNVPLFSELATRLNNQALPQHLDKIVIREYSVPEDFAPRVVQYFVEGAKEAGVLSPTTGLITANPLHVGAIDTRIVPGAGSISIIGGSPSVDSEPDTVAAEAADSESVTSAVAGNNYTIRITGPGFDTKIVVNEVDDLEIVDVMLKRVRRRLEAEEKVSDS